MGIGSSAIAATESIPSCVDPNSVQSVWFLIYSSAAVRRKVDMLHPLVSANSVKRAFSCSVIIKGIGLLRFRLSAFFGAPLLGVLLDSSLVTLFLQ